MDTRELIYLMEGLETLVEAIEAAGMDSGRNAIEIVAATEIALSSQAAEIERLREALKPFADYCDELKGFLDNHNQPLPDDDGPGWVYVKVGDFRRARAALTPKPNKEG